MTPRPTAPLAVRSFPARERELAPGRPAARTASGARAGAAGFTMIEIMIVVGIMGIVLAMGVPIAYRVWHREAMAQAVRDVVEVCSHARAQAIMRGAMAEVVFHPREGRLEVSSAPPPPPAHDAAGLLPEPSPAAPPPPAAGLSAQLSNRLTIEMLDVNLTEYRDEETARVRFFPNGTCDELTLILLSDKNERREITLEVTTSLASVESDPQKFR
jgi:prepilin-type N-terminal cleavage/methylation domain-containing protein